MMRTRAAGSESPASLSRVQQWCTHSILYTSHYTNLYRQRCNVQEREQRNLRHYARVFSISRLHLSSKKLADNTKGHLKFFETKRERKNNNFVWWVQSLDICKGQKNHLFAPVLIINAKKMHCYHMALNRVFFVFFFFKSWQSLEILQRAVNHSFKMARKRLVLHDCMIQSKQHFIKKVWSPVGLQQNNRRTSAMTRSNTLMQTFLCPKVDLLQLQISCQTEWKEKKQQWATSYLNAEESAVYVYNTMLSTCWLYTPSVTSVGLKWQYIQNDSFPVLHCHIHIRPC